MDKCVLNHSIIFSFDHPAATCGLARSFPAYPNSKSKMINGEIGPSISIDFLDNSSGVKVIKLDRARSVLKSNEFFSIIFDYNTVSQQNLIILPKYSIECTQIGNHGTQCIL